MRIGDILSVSEGSRGSNPQPILFFLLERGKKDETKRKTTC